MTKVAHQDLSRRERQIIDALYKLGRASAADIRAELPAAPSYSAVRSLLRILEEKGHIRHEQDGPRYLYVPVVGYIMAKAGITLSDFTYTRPRQSLCVLYGTTVCPT